MGKFVKKTDRIMKINKNRKSSKNYWSKIYYKKYSSIPPQLDGLSKELFDLIKKKIKKDKNKKVVEIGSAPGYNLIYFNKLFSYKPYGIEYTQSGCKINKEVFKKNNINGEVICEDFLDDKLIQKYENYFDVVCSFGFLEHFNDVDKIIKNHIKLSRKSGYIIITIPNLRGINYAFNYFFNKKLFEIHNLDIMDLNEFRSLFKEYDLEVLYSNYFGDFNFGLFNTDNFIKKFLLRIGYVMNKPVSKSIKFLFDKKNYSPYLVFIGKVI